MPSAAVQEVSRFVSSATAFSFVLVGNLFYCSFVVHFVYSFIALFTLLQEQQTPSMAYQCITIARLTNTYET